MRAQQPFDPRRERASHADTRPPGCLQVVDDGGREFGLGKGPGELLDRLLDPGIQRERRNRELARTLHVGQRDGAGLELGIEHRTAPHFLPIVILGVDPEDRDCWDVLPFGSDVSEAQRRERLQEREQRSAERSGLLTRDDRDG